MSEDPRKNLLKYLLNNTRTSSSLRSFVPGRIEIASFIITIILFVLIGIVGYFGLGERYAIGIAYLIGVTLLTPMTVTIIRDAKIIRSPTRMLIESSILKMDDQDSLIERFPSKDIDDLNRIKDHLEFEVNGLIARTSVIAGSIGRLGPVQAMFLIYTSYYLKLFNILPKNMMAAAMILVIGMYAIGVASVLVSERVKQMIYVTEVAIYEAEGKLKGNTESETEQNDETVA